MKLLLLLFFAKVELSRELSLVVVFAFDPSVYPSLAMAFCRRLLVCYTMPSSTIARASHARCARCGSASEPVTIYKRCD